MFPPLTYFFGDKAYKLPSHSSYVLPSMSIFFSACLLVTSRKSISNKGCEHLRQWIRG